MLIPAICADVPAKLKLHTYIQCHSDRAVHVVSFDNEYSEATY